ncbi:hypothetical protein Tco_1338138 [Tanacetum coccineum]
MTKVTNLEANLEQFKIDQAAINSEASEHRALLQETIEKNKVEVDRQFAKIMRVLSRTVSKNLPRKIQPASETDLQDIHDTSNCHNLKPLMDVTQEGQARSKPSYCPFGPDLRCDNVLHLVVVQGLGINYKRSGLEFYSTMILVVYLEPNILYGPLFEQMMTWDPGITVRPDFEATP